jgi:hypothetical protein
VSAGSGADDHRDRAGVGRGQRPRLGQGKDEAIETDPEADAWRRTAAHELDQAVVAPSPTDGLLLSPRAR